MLRHAHRPGCLTGHEHIGDLLGPAEFSKGVRPAPIDAKRRCCAAQTENSQIVCRPFENSNRLDKGDSDGIVAHIPPSISGVPHASWCVGKYVGAAAVDSATSTTRLL